MDRGANNEAAAAADRAYTARKAEIEQKSVDKLSREEMVWKAEGFPKDAMLVQHWGASDAAAERALTLLMASRGCFIGNHIDMYEHKVGPRNGAQVIAKAWADSDFKRALLESPTPAIESLGFAGRQGEHMKVVENTPEVHNLVVCTLCSCYPWPVLGLPPVWYKSAPYRSRAVSDPRGVLAEFGTELADSVEVQVWDSTSEMRYLVVPERPAGTDGWPRRHGHRHRHDE